MTNIYAVSLLARHIIIIIIIIVIIIICMITLMTQMSAPCRERILQSRLLADRPGTGAAAAGASPRAGTGSFEGECVETRRLTWSPDL